MIEDEAAEAQSRNDDIGGTDVVIAEGRYGVLEWGMHHLRQRMTRDLV